MKTANRGAGRVAPGLPLRAPTPPDMRVRVRRFLTVLADETAALSLPRRSLPTVQPSGLIAAGQDLRRSRLPAKFSPSRVVRPSGVFPGSYLPVLWPLLTPVLPQRPSRVAAPGVAVVPEAQVSLSKNVNSCCATGPFTSGTERGALLCCASLPVPSALYGLSVRRLISVDRWLPSHGTSRLRSCFGLMFGPSCSPL